MGAGLRRLPVFLSEALDELQHAAVRHQVQGALALVVGVADVGPLLGQEAGHAGADAQLGVPQQARRIQLWRGRRERERAAPG